jgi:chromosome segregation ATPase
MAQRNEFADQIDALREQKQSIDGGANEKRAEGQAMEGKLQKMMKSIGVGSKEEMKFLKEIQELKKCRPKVAQVKAMEASVVGFNPLQGSEKENIAAIMSEVNSLRDGRRKIQGALSELMEGRKAEQGDMGPMIAEKEEIRRKIQEKRQERNTLRDDCRVKETEYRTYMDKVRVERQKMYIVQREASNKEYDLIRRQRAVEKLDEQPFVSEITLIEQTMAFCKTLPRRRAARRRRR